MCRTMKKITKIYSLLLMGSITFCAIMAMIYGIVAILHGSAPFGVVIFLVGGIFSKAGIQCLREIWRK